MIKENKRFIKINKYQIDYTQLLGKGGMASVFLCYYAEGQGDQDARFAVKEISINSSFAVTDSLLQEINLLRKISHPFILKYIDAKKSSTSLYLILEYCDGGTLEDEVFQGLSENMLKKYIAQIVIALKYMKDEKIIHRDIKPKNILIHKGNIKISDFGVAKIINQYNFDKETVTFSGTVQFMSPQILRQDKYTFQTDIWSLGITIYFMAFKKLPWTSNKVLGILKEIESEQLKVPEYGISPLLKDLIEKMLVEDEEKRVTIEQLLEHEYIKEEVISQVKEYNMDHTYIPVEITKDEFMIITESMKSNQEEKLYRRSMEVQELIKTSMQSQDRAREAIKKLTNIKEQILFFKQILGNLRYYHQKKAKLFSTDLFKKCQFLLVKRTFIIAKDLHHILSLKTHTQGNLIIPKNQFIELIDQTKPANKYCRVIRNQVWELHEEFTNEWRSTTQSFYEYQRRYGIKIIPREDAYLQNLIENKNLILAFNDCFLELFMILSEGIVETYAHKLSEPIIIENIMLNHGIRISFVYDLMIILCFPRLTECGNMNNYKDKKKYVTCHEFIYRIQIAYNLWKERYELEIKNE